MFALQVYAQGCVKRCAVFAACGSCVRQGGRSSLPDEKKGIHRRNLKELLYDTVFSGKGTRGMLWKWGEQ